MSVTTVDDIAAISDMIVYRLLTMRRFEIAVRYNELLNLPDRTSHDSAKDIAEYNAELHRQREYWIDIYRLLGAEGFEWHPWYKWRYCNWGRHAHVHRALDRACRLIGFNFDYTLKLIARYADRTDPVGPILIEETKRQCLGWTLAEAIWHDQRLLPVCIPEHAEDYRDRLRRLINDLIRTTFETDQYHHPKVWGTWRFTQEIVDEYLRVTHFTDDLPFPDGGSIDCEGVASED